MPAAMDIPPAASLHEAKRALRARVLALRDAMPHDVRVRASRTIGERIEELPAFRAARTVLLTLPYGSEWDSWPLAQHVAASRQRLVVPRVDPVTRMLALHAVDDLVRDVGPGYRGIPEPHESVPGVASAAVDFVVVPGVAFDVHGGRLGYGGGYYDRLLPLLRSDVAQAAGAFDEQIVDMVPTASHDRHVPLVVTPTRIIVTGPR